MSKKPLRVAIVGAGYAGMAAAVELCAAGVAVDVFEASRTLGGRARRADIDGAAYDNGQHILVGAYSETLRLMRLVGADPEQLLLRQPLDLAYPGVMHIKAPALPAPLHLVVALLGAQGLSWREKWAAIRFMQHLKGCRFQLSSDLSVHDILENLKQPERLRRYLWEPLCIATLNTPTDSASAQVFANVLRDTLGAGRAASDLLLPRADLTALFPEPAAQYLESQGGRVLRGRRVVPLTANNDGWRIDEDSLPYDAVVLAVAPQHLPALLPEDAVLAPLRQQLASLHFEPIVTAYLRYPASVRLSQPMLGYGDGLLQWLFDRGQLMGTPGTLAAVISAQGRHLDLPGDELAQRLDGEIRSFMPDLPALKSHRVITEKRATFACVPSLRRPATQTAIPSLLLAGDYIASDYPGTLESAVRSGISAARALIIR
ncbi:MAG TPA: hydroxysqualene dehydroxylase HpnE [Rhodocyclaceae bacterium]|nr:hydroxysqualene dehydroxylase HpnE [Rhodocyclaceae bacterium]